VSKEKVRTSKRVPAASSRLLEESLPHGPEKPTCTEIKKTNLGTLQGCDSRKKGATTSMLGRLRWRGSKRCHQSRMAWKEGSRENIRAHSGKTRPIASKGSAEAAQRSMKEQVIGMLMRIDQQGRECGGAPVSRLPASYLAFFICHTQHKTPYTTQRGGAGRQ